MEGKAKTPAGKAESVRLRRSASDEEAHRPPALHGDQPRCHKRFISDHLIDFVRSHPRFFRGNRVSK
ncbi:hypothetical protein V7034_00155 [Priestia megaterium]|uniref:hypothetical protein n=1 Tax=Priestia megaterium TaxID=1404 RepID=UPI001CDBE117|nr:hypothetical protein [Priestia megaterium]